MHVTPTERFAHVRPPQAIVFPSEAKVPESKRHLELRTALYSILKLAFARVAWIGSDQFVYWDPTDPGACLAPDVFVRRGGPDDDFDSWKVWERGAPHLAVEIASADDTGPAAVSAKVRRYHRAGVEELLRFDPEAGTLRIWDRVEGDLVERVLTPDRAPECAALALYWHVTSDSQGRRWLRLARDVAGHELLPSPEDVAKQALVQGEALGRAEALLKVLERRGLHPSDTERARVLGCRDRATLDDWLDRAIVASTVTDVFKD